MLEENVAQYTGPVVIKSEVSGLPGKSACERRESPAGSGPPAIRRTEGPVLAELLEVKKRPSRVRFCPRYVITPLLYSDCFCDARYNFIVRPGMCTPRYLKISQ
jgi:hypothetical protein